MKLTHAGDLIRRTSQLEAGLQAACLAHRDAVTAALSGARDPASLCAFCADHPALAAAARQVLADADAGVALIPLAAESLQALNSVAHAFAYASVMAPIEIKFREVAKMSVRPACMSLCALSRAF
jgi:hypothetical protein